MARQNDKRSGKDSGGGGSNGGGGKRSIPPGGWEKGDIARDMVIQPGDPEVPRKPGSRRKDKTIRASENSPSAAGASAEQSQGEQDK